jgi:hypothetical protein
VDGRETLSLANYRFSKVFGRRTFNNFTLLKNSSLTRKCSDRWGGNRGERWPFWHGLRES